LDGLLVLGAGREHDSKNERDELEPVSQGHGARSVT
jgi:hypothetical protein